MTNFSPSAFVRRLRVIVNAVSLGHKYERLTAVTPPFKLIPVPRKGETKRAEIMIRSAHFSYNGSGRLHCEDVDLNDLPGLLAEGGEEGVDNGLFSATPLYVYSRGQLEDNINAYKMAFRGRDHIIGFSLKVRGASVVTGYYTPFLSDCLG